MHRAEDATGNDVGAQLPRSPIHYIIIDCSPMSYLDAPAISTLSQVIEEYKTVDVTVFLSGCKGKQINTILQYGMNSW